MECYTLVNVSIPDSMIDIADTAFDECAKLEYNVYNNCNYLGNNDNPYAVLVKVNDTSITDFVVNEKTKIIHLNAFKGCSALTSVTLPNGLACIGTSAFSGCYQLNNIAIPNSVSLIKDNAFGGCSQIPLIEYGNGKYFGNSENPYLIFIDLVFAGIHDEIETCNVHKDTKFIMNGVFSYNTLKTVTVDSGNTVFHSDGNCIIETKSKTLKFGFQTSVIPTDGSVTSIAKYAFYNCNNLTSITIPDCVTIIEDYAFAECDKLKSVDFGKGVSRIEKYAFNNCKALANLTLGTSVTYMGSYVFRGCYALKDIQYDGSKEQWYAASEHASLSVDTGSYTVHCTDGDIVKRT